MWTQKCESHAGQRSLQQHAGWHLLIGEVAGPNLSCYWMSSRNVFHGLMPHCCSVQEALWVRWQAILHHPCGTNLFAIISNCQVRMMHNIGILPINYFLSRSSWSAVTGLSVTGWFWFLSMSSFVSRGGTITWESSPSSSCQCLYWSKFSANSMPLTYPSLRLFESMVQSNNTQ